MVHKVFIDFKKVLFKGYSVDNYEGDYLHFIISINLNQSKQPPKNQTFNLI